MKSLLLDTHVWIWLLGGFSELALKHRNIINDAANDGEVFIAAITLWELSMLACKQRIILEKPILTWIQEALNFIEVKPLTPEIAAECYQLPDNFHGDPADRIIVSTTRVHGLILLTRDEKIIDYAKQEYISVLAV